MEELKKTTLSEHGSTQTQSICTFAVRAVRSFPFLRLVWWWFSFQMCCPSVSCWSEEVLNIWSQCISDLITDFYALKPYCIPPGDKNCSHWLEIYHLETSGYGMHFPSFSDRFQPKILQNSVGFTKPGHPSLQLCNGLLLQKGVDNNDLGSYIQQSPAL